MTIHLCSTLHVICTILLHLSPASRRHTLQLGVQQLPKIPVHKLHDTSTSITSSTNTSTTSGKVSQSGKNQLPQKFVEQYENFAKEVCAC